MGWVNGGLPPKQGKRHECKVPMILRILNLGPDVGSRWDCDDCGKQWVIVRAPITRSLMWAELPAEEEPLGSPDNPINIMPKVVPTSARELAINLGDKFKGAGGATYEDVADLMGILALLERWGYLRFESKSATVQEDTR